VLHHAWEHARRRRTVVVRKGDPATMRNPPEPRWLADVPLRRARSRHHRKAARRRRAHPQVNARAGEGAYGGTVTFLRPPRAAAARLAEREGDEEE